MEFFIGIIILVVILVVRSNYKERKRQEEFQRKQFIEEQERKRENKIKRREELRFENLLVVFADNDTNERPKAILKRSNNVYASVQRVANNFEPFIVGETLRFEKEITNKWNWYDEMVYQRQLDENKQKKLDELNIEVIVVIYESINDKGKPIAIVKRKDGTYASIERVANNYEQYIVGESIRIKKEVIDRWNWYDETEFQKRLVIKKEHENQRKLKNKQEESEKKQNLEEDTKYEIVTVVFSAIEEGGKPTGILKRDNNTYSFVERQNGEFKLGSLKLLREITTKLIWVNEKEYVSRKKIKQQKKNEEIKLLQENIIGTKWYVTQSAIGLDDEIFEFCPNGVLKYGEIISKWELRDKQIIISHNNGYAILTGHITDNIISGTANNIKGVKWTFSGKQVLNCKTIKLQEDFLREQTPTQTKENRSQTFNQLVVKKDNWQEFQQILQQNNITTLFHFTDRANIASIQKQGGLYSWDYCENYGIIIPLQGGGNLSKDLDRRYSLQDYVRVSFVRNHPMMFVAQNEGRIHDPVVLTISIDVCYFRETRFANMNATKTGHKQGKLLENLKAIHFDTIRQLNHFDLDESEKPYFQAEILVKTHIPIKYITNINNYLQ